MTLPVIPALATAAVLGSAALAYGAGYEVRSFRLRRVTVAVLAPEQRPLRLLHISDMHLTPRRRETVEWVAGLAALRPDLVINTGDNLAHEAAVPHALTALDPLMEFPGVFVMGSNDYHGPLRSNPVRYLFGDSREDDVGPPLPTGSLIDAMTARGWLNLNNARGVLDLDGREVELVGVDDPHLDRDVYDQQPARADVAATIGVAHAPYLRVVNAMISDGAALVLAGHTHGGQVNVPRYVPLVSNCDLPPRYAKGLHRWSAGGRDGWIHVSAGLGTSPFAPVRFACPPEATLITLTDRS
jgi:predicted MPP superfamily phosphohydrolase